MTTLVVLSASFLFLLFSQLCASYREIENKIIKLHESQSRGAVFLRRLRVLSTDECATNCATSPPCDTAIFHKDAVFSEKSNCYLVKCGSPSQCVFTTHPAYTVIEPTSTTDCSVSDWIVDSLCSVSCGNGTISYRRRPIRREIDRGGCSAIAMTKTEICHRSPCSVDCVVSEWTNFGPCSASCGIGLWHRSRTVLTEAKFNGRSCPKLSDVEICSFISCPVSKAGVEDEFFSDIAVAKSTSPGVDQRPTPTPLADDIEWIMKQLENMAPTTSLSIPSDTHNVAAHEDIFEPTEDPFNEPTEVPFTDHKTAIASSISSSHSKSDVVATAATTATTTGATTTATTTVTSAFHTSETQAKEAVLITVSENGTQSALGGLAESTFQGKGIGSGLVAAFVISLGVGVLFVVAALALMTRNWYGGFRWRKRYSRMEYLINDVDDDD